MRFESGGVTKGKLNRGRRVEDHCEQVGLRVEEYENERYELERERVTKRAEICTEYVTTVD